MKQCLISSILLAFLLGCVKVATSADVRCARCRKPIVGRYIQYQGRPYHPDCFTAVAPRCEGCGKPLTDEYHIYNGKKYHTQCLNNVLPRCDVCGEPLSGKYIQDFWGNRYHEPHQKQLTECEYCRRLICQRLTGGGVQYSDVRKVCSLCNRDAVVDRRQAVKIVQLLHRRLAAEGLTVDMRGVDVNLTDKKGLGKLTGSSQPKEMGVAHYELQQDGRGGILSEEYAIHILNGLPMRIFEGVAAHEMMHIWEYRHYKQRRDPPLSEGAANYAAYLIFAQYHDRQSEYLIKNLLEDPDRVYGDGFRQVEQYVRSRGLPMLLKHMQKSGTMPR